MRDDPDSMAGRAITVAQVIAVSRDSRLIVHGLRQLSRIDATKSTEVLRYEPHPLFPIEYEQASAGLARYLLATAFARVELETLIFDALCVNSASDSGPLTQLDAHDRLVNWLALHGFRQPFNSYQTQSRP